MRVRSICVLAVLACLAIANTAHAQDTGMLPGGAVLAWPRLFVPDANGDLVEPPDSESLRLRLNLASCLCSQADPNSNTALYYELTMAPTTNMNLPAKVFVGSECQDDIQRPINCHEVPGVGLADIDVLSTRAENIRVPLIDLISPRTDQPTTCNQVNGGTAFVWVTVDTDANGDDDFFSPRPLHLGLFTDVTGFDTLPPPLPTNLSATGGEGSIQLTWEIPDSNATDLYAFQAFCMDATGAAVGPGETPLYSTTQTVCNIPAPLDLVATTIISDEGTEVPTAPAAFSNLDPAFLCATQPSGTATSLDIDGLENNMEYTVALVAVDFYGNPTGTFFTRTVIPKPVTDFWEDLHDRGGVVEGGFCAAGGGDDGGALGLLLPLALAGLLVMRRKKAAVHLATLAIVLVPAIASADDFTPYWEDPATTNTGFDSSFGDKVKWRAGIKLGPYTPAIDDQLGKNPVSGMGPYQAMFGNYFTDKDNDGMLEAVDAHVYQILPMLDVERVIWSRSGHLSVGGTLGYMQKSAYAYLDGTTADDPRRLRSLASRNTFRLIPFALTASYRATQLDDNYGIPFVPYVRGGLAYYVWWLKGPSGNLSKVCKDGSTDIENCDANKAYGGTLGLMGTLGLSIRAERIDADAARAMKNSGIQHAGFYVELMTAVVNGFGSDKKLSVGDSTWFAGFDFEF